MKYTLLIFLSTVFLCACGDGGNNIKKNASTADTSQLYPLSAFFTSQIEHVDLRNFTIYRITVIDGKKDSAGLSKDAFAKWAEIFLRHSFANTNNKSAYKETVFEDLSTESYTINYTPYKPDEVSVKNIDILLAKETNMVKRVFIRSQYAKGDTTVEEHCNWKADKSFQVNRMLYTNKGFRSTELNFINWNE